MKFLYIIPGRENSNDFVFAKREYSILSELLPQSAHVAYLNTTSGLFVLTKDLLKIRRLVVQNQIDIVHSQYGTITALCSLLVSWRRKLVITFRGSDINGTLHGGMLRSRLSLVLSWISMSFADYTIFVSQRLMERSPSFFNNFAIIPSGVDVKVFFPQDKDASRERLNLKKDLTYILFFSSFGSANKRPDLAYGSFKKLKERGYDNFELIVVDGGVPKEEMPIYLNAADVVLMLSDNEGSPTIVQEALACGTAIVSVDVGDTREMLAGVVNSIIVSRSIESIADGIVSVARVGKIRPAESTISKISLNECTEKIKSIYYAILG